MQVRRMDMERLAKIEVHLEHIIEELQRNTEQHSELKTALEKQGNKFAAKWCEGAVKAALSFLIVTLVSILLVLLGLR